MIKRPNIREMFLPVNEFSRPGRKLVSVKGVVIHWTGNADVGIEEHYKYFKSLSEQDPNDDEWDRYAGAHFFIDTDGEIGQLIPENEMAYHVGAHEYKDGILNKFNTTYPNNCLIGIEMCHPDDTGKFTEYTYLRTIQLVSHLVEKYDLTLSDVVRHYDVTGKKCPKYFVENEEAYEVFLNDIENILQKSTIAASPIKLNVIAEYANGSK